MESLYIFIHSPYGWISWGGACITLVADALEDQQGNVHHSGGLIQDMSRLTEWIRVDQSGWMRDIQHVFHDVSCVSDLQATMFEHFLRNMEPPMVHDLPTETGDLSMIFLYVFLWFLMFQMNVLYVFYVFSCDFLCFMWHKNLWTSPKTTIFLHFPATFATFATLPSRPPPHLATPPAAATLRQRPRQGQAPRWMRSFARALRARAPRPSAILKEGRLKVLKTSCFNVFLMFYNVFF